MLTAPENNELAPLRSAIEQRTADVVREAVRAGLHRGIEQALTDLLAMMGPALNSSARGELTAVVAQLAGASGNSGSSPTSSKEPPPSAEPVKPEATNRRRKKPAEPEEAKALAKAHGHRRSAEQIEELSGRVLAVVREKGGLRAEHIAARLHLVASDIRDVLLRLAEKRSLRAEGKRRGKRYFAL